MRKSGLVALALIALLAGFGAARWLGVGVTPPDASLIGGLRPDFGFQDLDGRMHHAAEWDGKVVVLNFWASWCPPCRNEMPAFVELQGDLGARGLQFVGIAIDRADAARDFADEIGVNYPILLGEAAALPLMTALGNRLGALPYTVVIDRSGRIAHLVLRELDRAATLALVQPLL